jgi:hypothetical protein
VQKLDGLEEMDEFWTHTLTKIAGGNLHRPTESDEIESETKRCGI